MEVKRLGIIGTGLIGANKVLSAQADGYTFFHGSINEVFLAPMLNPSARYTPKDFSLVAPISEAHIVLLARNGAQTLERAARHVRPGGMLAYMTCSLLERENQGQVARFLATRPEFTKLDAATWTPLTASDGFFLARLAR